MVNEETGILEEIISRITSISEASEKVLRSLETQKISTESISRNIESLASNVTEIEHATDEEKRAAHEINSSVQSVTQEAQAISEGSIVIKDSAEELLEKEQILRKLVTHFKVKS